MAVIRHEKTCKRVKYSEIQANNTVTDHLVDLVRFFCSAVVAEAQQLLVYYVIGEYRICDRAMHVVQSLSVNGTFPRKHIS